MKHTGRIVFVLVLIGILMVPALAMAGDPLLDLMATMDQRAKADLIRFNKELSSTFGVPVPDVEALFKVLPTPGDVYMALRVSDLTGKPTKTVVTEFKNNKGKGWGVIAQRMGIKPGSKEFHALKQSRLPNRPGGAPSAAPAGGKGPDSKGPAGKGPAGNGGGSHGGGKGKK